MLLDTCEKNGNQDTYPYKRIKWYTQLPVTHFHSMHQYTLHTAKSWNQLSNCQRSIKTVDCSNRIDHRILRFIIIVNKKYIRTNILRYQYFTIKPCETAPTYTPSVCNTYID